MSDDRKAVRVSAESDKAIRTYANRKGIEFGEAADALIATGVSRLNALARYKKKSEQGEKPGKRPAKKKAEAKPKAKAKPKAAAKKATEAKPKAAKKEKAESKASKANGLAEHAPAAEASEEASV